MTLGIDSALAETSLFVWLMNTVGHEKGLSIIIAGSRQEVFIRPGKRKSKVGSERDEF